MSVTRINEFQAKAEQEQALQAFLRTVVATVLALPGCSSCQLLASQQTPGRFVVLEVWDSIAAHQGAAQAIPAAEIQKVMAMLAGSPKGEYFS